MAAIDHVHPMQMQLFVDPEEHIKNVVGSVDYGGGRSWESLWRRKLSESKEPAGTYFHGAGLYESLKRKGVDWNNWQKPTMFPAEDESGWIHGEGHHRMAAAAEVQRKTGRKMWMPIEYNMTYTSSRYRPETEEETTAPRPRQQRARKRNP